MERADAAFIGVLRAKTVAVDGQAATYTFEVEEVVKGQLERTLAVHSTAYGAACGIETRVGSRTGLFLYRDGSRWQSSLCSQISPAELRRAAKPLPRPTGAGPVRFLVAGAFGAARLLALDGRGRTLAYGRGRGTASGVSVCPGGVHAVEVVRDDERLITELAVRRLSSMQVASGVVLSQDRDESFTAVQCGARGGRLVFAFGARYQDRPTSRLVRIRDRVVTTVHRGSADRATFRGGTAFLSGDAQFGIRAVDLASGRERVLSRQAVSSRVAVSPSGRKLAAHLRRPNRLAVIELSGRTAGVSLGPRIPFNVFGDLVWLTESRLGFFAGGGDSDRAIVYGRSFRRLGAFLWGARITVVRGGVAYGLAHGKMRIASLPKGPARALRTFFSPETYDLALVPGNVRVRPQPRTLACDRG